MREIKFRGMDINGKWHNGDLSVLKEGISSAVGPGSYISNSVGMPFAYLVRPETIGQFTGLHDKNGKEIYEGDIVSFKDVSGYEDGTATIIWNNDSCGFYLENDDENIYDTIYDFTPAYQMEVIGNIHEATS